MNLFIAIIILAVFIVYLIDIITAYRESSEIKMKEIVYLIGWLILSITSFLNYFNKD